MNKYILLPLLTLGVMTSCVDDKGSYDYTPLNTVTIEDLESSYDAIQGFTELTIEPKIKGDIYGKDLDNYDFEWHICRAEIGSNNHDHRFLSDEPVLNWKVDEPVGSYTIYFTVTDKESKLEKRAYTNVKVSSPFGRGFVLLGTNGKDDLARVDMLAMPASGDTAVVENAFYNDGTYRKPKGFQSTGRYSTAYDYMWLFCEDSDCKLNSVVDSATDEFEVLGSFSSLAIADNEYEKYNEVAVGYFPSRAPGGVNVNNGTQSLGFITKECIYGPTGPIFGSYYSMPVNRMANSITSPLFKFYPKVFYNGALTRHSGWMATGTPYYVYNYDMDALVKITITGMAGSHCSDLIDTGSGAATWRYNCKSQDRTLVWGDNGSTGYCCFVMKSTVQNNVYEIYGFQPVSLYSQNKDKFPVDLSIAKDFEKAELYAMIGCRRSIFYAVGSVLHQYDFQRGLHIEKDLGAQITMIKPEYYSRSGRHNDLMVATWDDQASQGTFMKFVIGDNPNNISMELRNDIIDPVRPNPEHERYLEKWTTRLKIVDADWRNE